MIRNMTNLHPTAAAEFGFDHVPCILPKAVAACAGQPAYVINHETEDELLEAADAGAITRAHEVITSFRAVNPEGLLAVYGWPYPRNYTQAKAFAKTYTSLLNRCDFLAPCCYRSGALDPSNIERGNLYADCVKLMSAELQEMPRIGFVSDWTIDSQHLCTHAQRRTQCRAAIRAGCGAIYVFSGLGATVNAATTPPSASKEVNDNRAMAWATLTGTHSMSLPSMSPADIDAAYLASSRNTLTAFTRALAKETNR